MTTTTEIQLKDPDEIAEFYLETTGMLPGYAQLSKGPSVLEMVVTELAGLTLIWTRSTARVRWRDVMTGEGLHAGFVVQGERPVLSRGRSLDLDEAQVWLPGVETDLVIPGPVCTLDIGVEPALVEQLGWDLGGEPVRQVPMGSLQRLITAARRVTGRPECETYGPGTPSPLERRDVVLDVLEPVLHPWLSESEVDDSLIQSGSDHYRLVRCADDFLALLEPGSPFDIDELARSLGVSRRTVFHAYKKILGVGPSRYFELMRLHSLRARLRRARPEEASVTRLATDLGFSELGRLAGRYRDVFGEGPSDTLRSGTG